MLAFIHIPRTGGKSMAQLLRSNYGLRHCDVEPFQRKLGYFSASDFRKLKWIYPRLISIAGHDVKAYSDLEHVIQDIKYFTTLRNPLERCIAQYRYSVQIQFNMVPFEKWILDERVRNVSTKILAGSDDAEVAIEVAKNKLFFVGLIERFDETLLLLQKKIGCNSFKIFPTFFKEISKKNIIDEEIKGNDQKMALLMDANKSDLRLYDFVYNELFDKYCVEYGNDLKDDAAKFASSKIENNCNYLKTLNVVKRNLIYKPILYSHEYGRNWLKYKLRLFALNRLKNWNILSIRKK